MKTKSPGFVLKVGEVFPKEMMVQTGVKVAAFGQRKGGMGEWVHWRTAGLSTGQGVWSLHSLTLPSLPSNPTLLLPSL